MTRSSSPTDGLATLSAQVHEDLAKIRYATGNWNIPVQKDGEDVLDVAIIGGGQGGADGLFRAASSGRDEYTGF